MGFPDGTSGKEHTCQCKRCERREFNPWVQKIPWRRACRPPLVFLPGESQGQTEPGRLQPMGSQRLRNDWNDSAHTWSIAFKNYESPCCIPLIFTILFINYISIFIKVKKRKENSKKFQKKFSNFSVLQNLLEARTPTVFTLVVLDGFKSI